MKSSLKISRQINVDLMIASRLISKTKEQLAEELLTEGLKPIMAKIIKQRFQ